MSKFIDRTGEIKDDMVIIAYRKNNDIDVKFDDGTIIEHRTYSDFKKGKILNYNKISCYGVGKLGGRVKNKNVYNKWISMLHRCYSGKDKLYKNVSVSDEWLTYVNFENYILEKGWDILFEQGYDLDKDLFSNGINKIYSKETCIPLPREVNTFITNTNKYNKSGYLGVTPHRDKFRATARYNFKQVFLGSYQTKEEAFFAYKKFRIERAKELCLKYNLDKYISEKLIKREEDLKPFM